MSVEVEVPPLGQTWRCRGEPLAEGQKWKCRDETQALIEGPSLMANRDRFPWIVQSDTYGRYAVTPGGHVGYLCVSAGDLVELISQPAPAPVPQAVDLPVESIELAAADLPDRAPDILEAAAGHLRDRAATYDKPEGERSMAQTVAIFNQFHGAGMTEAQGWHFMQILKDVRLFTRDGYHQDSGEDCVAYAALKCEAKAREGGVAC